MLDLKVRRCGRSGSGVNHPQPAFTASQQSGYPLLNRLAAPALLQHDRGWTAECSCCDHHYRRCIRRNSLRCHHCGQSASGAASALPVSTHLVRWSGTEQLEYRLRRCSAPISCIRPRYHQPQGAKQQLVKCTARREDPTRHQHAGERSPLSGCDAGGVTGCGTARCFLPISARQNVSPSFTPRSPTLACG